LAQGVELVDGEPEALVSPASWGRLMASKMARRIQVLMMLRSVAISLAL